MRTQRFLHILNPNQRNREGVKKLFDKNPRISHVWVERTSHPTHLETIVEWALQQGLDHFALWGGDGSFNRMIQALYDQKALSKVTVALMPAGTGNDFARNLGLSGWRSLLPRLFAETSRVEKFDVGLLEVDGKKRIFVNNAGFGRTPVALKKARPNPLDDIKAFSEKKLEIESEESGNRQFETVRAFLGIVFNAPYFNKGLYFDKQISPADGKLQAVLIPPQNRWKLLLRFAKGRMGSSLADKKDVWVEGQQISFESDQLLYPQVDGDPAGKVGSKQLQFSVLKQSLNLLVPKEAA